MHPRLIRSLTGTADHPVLTFRRRYRAGPAEVRDACTNTQRLARWFGQVTGTPAGVGDSFTAFLGGDADVAEGRVLRCEEDEIAVTWSWQGEPESIITARINPVDEQYTELILQHALTEPDHAVGYGGGWEQMLHSLARALDAASPPAPPDEQAAPPDEQIEAEAVRRWGTITRAPLQIERVLPAHVDRVWSALATPEGLRSWWWRHWSDVRIDADVRLGGAYRIEAPGAGIAVAGTYLAVEEPSHLAFTWQWQHSDGTSADESVHIDIRGESGDDGSASTRITLRHTGPWSDDTPAQSYREGWDDVLDELTRVLRAS